MDSLTPADKNKMRAAQELLREKRYGEAKSLLRGINHPKAREWSQKIDAILAQQHPIQVRMPVQPPPPPPEQYYAPPRERQQNYIAPPPQYYYPTMAVQSFTSRLILTILLLFTFILPGLIALVVFSREAKEAQSRSNQPIPGAQALILLNRYLFLILLAGLLLLVVPLLISLIGYYS